MSLPNLISLQFLLPYTAHKLNLLGALRGLRGMPRRILLIGHKSTDGVTTGTAVAGQITKAVGTEADMLAYCGEGSMLAAMWRGAKLNTDLGMVIDILPLSENGSATVATGTFTVSGTPTLSGEVMVYVEGERFSVGATTTDTATTIAAKLVTAINANAALSATASATAGVVTLTSKWKGATANDIDLRNTYAQDDIMVQGVTVAVVAMSGGATNPDLSAYVGAALNYRATEIVCPFNDSTAMGILEQEQETRWGCTNKQDGQFITVKRGTLAAQLAWLQPRNSRQGHSLQVYKDMTSPWATAAMAAAAIESSAAIDAVVPYTGTLLKGYKGPAAKDVWDMNNDANNMALAGGSVIEANEDGTGNLLRMFTHYKRSPSGAVDTSGRELCHIKIASYWRWVHVNEFETKFRDGWKQDQYATEAIPGQKIMTKDLGEEIMIALYETFIAAGLFTHLEHYKSTLLVELDPVNGKIKIMDEPVMVMQHYQTEITSNLLTSV